MKNWFQIFSKSKGEYLLAVLNFTCTTGEKKKSLDCFKTYNVKKLQWEVGAIAITYK